MDIPPGLELAAAQRKVCLASVTDVFVSHSHPDHLDPNALTGRVSPCGYQPEVGRLCLHGNRRSTEILENHGKTNQFYDPQKLKLDFHVVEPFVTFAAGELSVTPLLAQHGTAPESDPLNYIIERDGRTLLYACDTGWFPEPTWCELAKHKLDLVVLELTTYWREQGVDTKYHHMDMSTFLAARAWLVEMGCLEEGCTVVAQHICHHPSQGELEERLKRENVMLARDGLCLRL
jgi:phosphoribosyl 1,2-cyclic phosphate phosphodiesterase